MPDPAAMSTDDNQKVAYDLYLHLLEENREAKRRKHETDRIRKAEDYISHD